MNSRRTEEIFEIISRRPGATGATIYRELLKQSLAGRIFGTDSFITIILGPALSNIYPHLERLEQDGRVYAHWGSKTKNGYRRRHYYVQGTGGCGSGPMSFTTSEAWHS